MAIGLPSESLLATRYDAHQHLRRSVPCPRFAGGSFCKWRPAPPRWLPRRRFITAKKTDSPVILGSGEHRYEVQHNWPQLPDKFTWQTTHNVAFDKAGNLYVIHEGDTRQPDHPAIFVFDPEGKYIRSFGKEFQGGGHGLEVHEEDGEEFLYVTGYQHLKKFAKLTLDGETVWVRHAPMESGIYAADEDTKPDGTWGRDRFMPTNIAFHPTNGDFYVADGYGAYAIHVYDRDANYKSTFGKEGKEDGQFDTAARRVDRQPHGPRAVDRRRRPRERPAAMVHARRQTPGNARRLPAAGQRRHVRRRDARARAASARHAARWQEQGRSRDWATTRLGARTS